MFKINDYIIYGGNGVCKVVDIGIPNLYRSGEKKEYYTLEPLYENGKIFTPVDNDKVVMRKIISKEEVDKLIRGINKLNVEWIQDNKEREVKFKEMYSKFSCSDFLRLIKIILERKKICAAEGKKLSIMDDRYLKKAKEYIDNEFAVALNIPKDMVNKYIKNSIIK